VTKAQNKTEYYLAAKKIFKTSSVLLVEEFCSGLNDYRVVVLDNEVISVYQRVPLQVV
jgi:D-alanine-D-alanine ligase-like ATP-grasp enzyme